MDKKYDEMVLCVTEEYYQNYRETMPHTTEMFVANLDSGDCGFVDRNEAEKPGCGYLQLIPYIAITFENKIFIVQRIQGSSEKRLVGLKSIGIGGHINDGDQFIANSPSCKDWLEAGARRELLEEVNVDLYQYPFSFEQLRLVPPIYDPSNEVGSVHIGIPYVLNFRTEPKISVRETHKLEGSLSDIPETLEGFETWSQKYLQALFPEQYDNQESD